MKFQYHNIPLQWRITIGMLLWLFLISVTHYLLNSNTGDRRIVTMGYMPVFTNLAAPLLDYASKEGKDVRFKGMKFSSFAEMAEALRNDQIDVAFIIAPLSIVLRQQGNDVKIVYIGNRHESTFVTRKNLHVDRIEDLIGKEIAVPMRYSGHNLSVMQLIEQKGLKDSINVVEMNPPDMASALSTGSLDAYFVGEPFAAQTLKSGDAELLHYGEDLWDGFICNLVIVKQDLIEDDPEIVKLMVQGAARSGIWANENKIQAAEIASEYWNQSLELVKYVFETSADRIVYDRYKPEESEIQEIADLMQHFGMVENNNIDGLVDDSFAKNINMEGLSAEASSILNNSL